MTGMPAFGATHDDDKIWDIVAFVRQLHEMTPQQYTNTTWHSAAAQGDGHRTDEHELRRGAHEHGHD